MIDIIDDDWLSGDNIKLRFGKVKKVKDYCVKFEEKNAEILLQRNLKENFN
jgi:hypothetical protein